MIPASPVTLVPIPLDRGEAAQERSLAVIVRGRFRIDIPHDFSPALLTSVVETLERVR